MNFLVTFRLVLGKSEGNKKIILLWSIFCDTKAFITLLLMEV